MQFTENVITYSLRSALQMYKGPHAPTQLYVALNYTLQQLHYDNCAATIALQ